MSVTVLIPIALYAPTQNQNSLHTEGSTISEMIDDLEKKFPGIKTRLCDDQGTPREHVAIFVNSDDISFLDHENTALKDGDHVSIDYYIG